MSAFSNSISISIGIHPETHLVPSKVRVHRITVPFLILHFHVLKPCHLDNPWWLLLKELVHQPRLLLKGIRHTALCTQLTDQHSHLHHMLEEELGGVLSRSGNMTPLTSSESLHHSLALRTCSEQAALGIPPSADPNLCVRGQPHSHLGIERCDYHMFLNVPAIILSVWW